MPPERLPGDRKDFCKERKPRWRESSSSHYGSSRDFPRWGGSNEFRRPPGHGKQGGWHLFTEESGHGYAPFRSSDRILEEKNFRTSVSRGDGKYGRNGRDNRGSFSQRDWRANSWELNNGSLNMPGRLHDARNDQKSVDDTVTYPSSHPRTEFLTSWDQLHSKDLHDNSKMVVGNGMGTGQRGDRENLDWKPLNKWTRSGSLSSRGSGFSHSSSSKSLGGADSYEGKAELQLKNASLVQSPSGDAAACVTSAPSDEMAARKKPRLNWGEGLAKYEKKKVESPEVNLSKDGVVISSNNIEPIHSQITTLVEKSPRVMGLSDCASPATPSSVACSSPGAEEKISGKEVTGDNDVSNLCGSPSIGSQSNIEGLSFNLEVLDATSVANLGAVLVELLQSDDSSSVDSSFIRSTAMNKLLILKGGISKALEVTESEIDLLENELKSLKFVSGSRYPCLEASSFLPAGDEVKLCNEQGAASDIPRPSPLQVSSCGAGDVEKIPICSGGLEEVHGGSKGDDVDSSGTATSKFVESMSTVKAVSSSDLVKHGECSGDVGGIETTNLVLKSVVPCTSDQGDEPACGDVDVNFLTECKGGDSFPNGASFVEDNLRNLILAANRESSSKACKVFSTLLPRDDCKIDFPEVANVAFRHNDVLVKEKFARRKQFLKFKERVVTLKFKAFQHLWKDDMRLLSIRKFRAKSQKKYESMRITHSGYQKNRSSVRSRFSSLVGNLSLIPTTEMLNFTSRLLSVSQVKLYRNALKMPALSLDNKERTVSRFISSNGLVEDPCAIEKERAMINPWSSEEREVFIDKLATFGKDFQKIASFLDHKTTADCVEFYYKNHKSDCFEKTKKRKQSKSSTNYLMASGKHWNREMNAASLDILGAASLIAADADNGMANQQMRSGRYYLGGYCNSKPSHGDDGNLDRSSNLDILENERETVAADVLAGICGSMSSEAMSSCITTSVDPGDGCREWKSQKVDSVRKRPSTSDVTENVDEETCSDESCGEMDPADWTDEEKSIFIRAVSSYGKDFATISRCVRTRSRDQCKVFFSKARKCLGLDSIHPGSGNLGTPLSDDANGGGSDAEGGAFEYGSVNCSSKLGSKTDDNLPLPVMDPKCEVSDDVERKILTTDLNRSKDNIVSVELVQNDLKVEETFVSDSCQMEHKPVQAIDIDNKSKDGSVCQSELMKAQEISNGSVSLEAGMEKPIEDNISVGDTVDPVPSNPVGDVKTVVEASANGSVNHLKAEELLSLENSLNDQSGLLRDSNASTDVSHQSLDMGSCSKFSLAMENMQHASMEIKSMDKSRIAAIPFRKMDNHDTLSSQFDIQENRDEQGKKLAGQDNDLQHLPGQRLVSCSESSQIIAGYPLPIPTKIEMNGDVSCRSPSEVQSLPTSDRGAANQFVGQDCYLRKCNNVKDECSVPELPLLSQHTEIGNDHPRDHSRSSSNVEKPCRNGDVKLFGKILTNSSCAQKSNPSINENVEQGTHCTKPGSKSSTLKFTGHQTTDGSSSVLKFDRNNYLGLENVPMKSYGFWDGNMIQTGFPSISEYFLAKYPAAFGSYHVSSSKMEQQALQAAMKCNDRNLTGVSVLPSREISSSKGVVDYQMYRSHDSSKVQPFSVDMKQRQDIFCEMQRRNGFEAISSLQQQGRGMVGMNVVGRGGVLVGGSCTGVSDPVTALKMHYSKTDQYGGQNGSMMREEESWRSKGDIGR